MSSLVESIASGLVSYCVGSGMLSESSPTLYSSVSLMMVILVQSVVGSDGLYC